MSENKNGTARDFMYLKNIFKRFYKQIVKRTKLGN